MPQLYMEPRSRHTTVTSVSHLSVDHVIFSQKAIRYDNTAELNEERVLKARTAAQSKFSQFL